MQAAPHDTINLAMSIGGTTRFGDVSPGRIDRFCEVNGLDKKRTRNMMLVLCESIPEAFVRAQEHDGGIVGMDELFERTYPSIRKICESLGASLLKQRVQ